MERNPIAETECVLCNRDHLNLQTLAKKKAAHTAHQLAIRQADNFCKAWHMDWVDIQNLFFAKIQKHEQERNLTWETEVDLDRQLQKYASSMNHYFCSYHSENVGWYFDGFHAKVFSKCRKAQQKSKWTLQKFQKSTDSDWT